MATQTAGTTLDEGAAGALTPDDRVALLRYIDVLEQCLGRRARKNLLPMQPGDLPDTWADVEALARDVGYRPSTDLESGVKQFVEWYLGYYHPQS